MIAATTEDESGQKKILRVSSGPIMRSLFLVVSNVCANGYTDLLPQLCATDHVIPKLIHAKLIRTHTCALGSDSCDYWYIGDESETARNYSGKLV